MYIKLEEKLKTDTLYGKMFVVHFTLRKSIADESLQTAYLVNFFCKNISKGNDCITRRLTDYGKGT